MLDLTKARQELATKTQLEIERMTAETWAARAAACYGLANDLNDDPTRQVRLIEAESYRQEALEHAARTEDVGFFQSILADVEGHRGAGQVRPARPSSRGRGPSNVKDLPGGVASEPTPDLPV